jgi:hypothetical protein
LFIPQRKKMLHLIKNVTDSFFDFLSQDPVRPNIPHNLRVGDNRDVFVSRNEDQTARAITCVSYQNTVPVDETQLFEITDHPDIVVFYTIWSYAPGAGRELIFEARSWIMEHRPEIQRFITLSPPTDMARRFHLNNGATIFQTNEKSVNYEYLS